MATLIREVECPTLGNLVGLAGRHHGEQLAAGREDHLRGIRFVGSGKGALALVLRYLSSQKVLANKLDEVLVADWIGYWVYNQIQPFAFTAKKLSKRTKALLVYHQYGFPQNMDAIMEFAHDHKLVVIEDCAHALASSYRGKHLGSFGNYTIYSFSKWVFCFALGGVRSKVDGFSASAEEWISKAPRCATVVKDGAKFLSEKSLFSANGVFKQYASLLLNMSYAIYGDALQPSRTAIRLLSAKIAHEIDLRQRRYRLFRDQADHLGICDHLEVDDVTPYVIPIKCTEARSERLVGALRARGIMTGTYNFDMNRNLLDPAFVPCVWIPCHSGIPDDIFQDITATVVKTV